MTCHITKEEFAKAISEGLNLTQTAIRFDVCLDTIRNWERRFGLKCRRGNNKRREKMKRKVVALFDITKLERCPYCSSTDIGQNPTTNCWICNSCGEKWED